MWRPMSSSPSPREAREHRREIGSFNLAETDTILKHHDLDGVFKKIGLKKIETQQT